MHDGAWTKRLLASRPLVAVAVGGIVLCVFLPVVACDFVNWDDGPYVYENADVIEGLSVRTFRNAWTTATFHNWAPLTTLSYLVDATFFGMRPWGFHLTSVLLHAASCGLLFLALERMTGAFWRSLVATLLFALHPLRVESVAWIAERKDVLSVFFLAVALLAYESYCRRPSLARYAAVAAAMTASLLAKATLVTLPILLLLLDLWPLGRIAGLPIRGAEPAASRPTSPWPRVLGEKIPLLILSAACTAVTIATQRDAIQEEWRVPLFAVRLPLGLWSIVRYLGMTVWPVGLHPSYCHPGADGVTPGVVLGGIAGVAAIAFVAALAWRSTPAVTIGLAWYAIALAPVLGIVKQQGFQSHADRFTYVPHLGLAVAIVWLAADLAAKFALRPRTIAAGVVAILAVFVVADERQIRHWRDNESLWTWVLAVEPTNDHGGQYLAAHFARTGRWDRAIELATEIACRYPRSQALADIAEIRSEQGDVAGAIAICRREVEVKTTAHGEDHPETLEAVARLVTALRNANDPEAYLLARRAEPAARRVLSVHHLATCRILLAIAAAANREGDPATAERYAREVLDVVARSREAPTELRKPATSILAESLDRQGRPAEAVAILRATLLSLGGTEGTKAVENSQLVLTLAAVLAGNGRPAEAEAALERVAEAAGRELGPGHPITLSAASLLERIRSTTRGEVEAHDAAPEDR